jgi:lipopolysaccharide export system protein LptA
MRRFTIILLAASLPVACAASAQQLFAQTGIAEVIAPSLTSSVQIDNKNVPPQIWAATLEIHDKNKSATFSGNVQVVQGDNTMRCRSLIVAYGPVTNSIVRMEARGGVTVLTKDQSASGDLGIYNLKTKAITLIGDVVITPKSEQ